MNIKVWDDKYVIKNDAHCYILKEVRKKASAEDDELEKAETDSDGNYEITVGYPSTVAGAFSLIVEREGRRNKCTTLDGYIKHLISINDKLEENLKKFEKLVGSDALFTSALARARKE